jgi:methyltransferase OMS1
MASGGRKAAVLLAGGSVYATTVYFSYHYLQMRKKETDATTDPSFSHVSNPKRNEQFQKIASFYDDEIGREELFMGINFLRRSLLFFHARGTTLEVGAGTARNLGFYPKSVKRLILTDQSDQMLHQAKEKIQGMTQQQVAVLQADSASLDLPDNAFDTVVDTFGLCSYSDPVVVLKEMARVCKPNGKILLLEHGRSKSFEFVTNHLDKNAERHAANWGCVFNRDLDAILQESGLEILILRKWHFGTTYYVVCRPKKGST